MTYVNPAALWRGDTFGTPFESECVALSAPDDDGEFIGLDSDGVECSFILPMVVWVQRLHGMIGS